MTSVQTRPTSAADTTADVVVADIGLLTRFGTGVSALSPFEDTSERRRTRGSGGARLGELLVSEGVISPEELAEALAAQKMTSPRKPLGELLLARGLVSPPLLVRLLAQQCQLELEEETGFGNGLRRAIERRHTERARAEETVEAWEENETAKVDEPPAAKPEASAVSEEPRLLGELLVAERLLSPGQLRWALAEQAKSGRLLGEIVVQNGLISMVELVNALVEQAAGEHGAVIEAPR
jgi:hypothetical protein